MYIYQFYAHGQRHSRLLIPPSTQLLSYSITVMLFIKLIGSPYVLRYYPGRTATSYQYRKQDQDPRLFQWQNNTLRLTPFYADLRTFSHLADAYLFLTECRRILPRNMENVFKVSKNRMWWVDVNRPLVHAPGMYDHEIRSIPETPQAAY
jgi:hypothetical protein